MSKNKINCKTGLKEGVIDEKTYNKEVEKLGRLSFVGVEGEAADVDKFCNNDVCEIEVIT